MVTEPRQNSFAENTKIMLQKELYKRWISLFDRYLNSSFDFLLVFNRIWKLHSGQRRFYHNGQHILNLLQDIDKYANEGHDKFCLSLAAFFHDSIYEPGYPFNEERSASFMAESLDGLRISKSLIKKTKRIIIATKTHECSNQANHDLTLFLDLDLAILASNTVEYESYCNSIRKEFNKYPDSIFYPARIKFLKKMLNRDNIYCNKQIRAVMEAAAKKNLTAELRLYGR